MTHICDKNDEDGWGNVVAACWSAEDGKLFVIGGGCGTEYKGQVNFCPFCGLRADVQVDPDEVRDYPETPVLPSEYRVP